MRILFVGLVLLYPLCRVKWMIDLRSGTIFWPDPKPSVQRTAYRKVLFPSKREAKHEVISRDEQADEAGEGIQTAYGEEAQRPGASCHTSNSNNPYSNNS